MQQFRGYFTLRKLLRTQFSKDNALLPWQMKGCWPSWFRYSFVFWAGGVKEAWLAWGWKKMRQQARKWRNGHECYLSKFRLNDKVTHEKSGLQSHIKCGLININMKKPQSITCITSDCKMEWHMYIYPSGSSTCILSFWQKLKCRVLIILWKALVLGRFLDSENLFLHKGKTWER